MTRRLCVVALVALALAGVLGLLGPAPATAAEDTSLADYAQRVHDARTMVDDAMPRIAQERVAHDVAAEVNTLLPSVETVSVGRQRVTVDNSIVRSLVASLDSALAGDGRRRAGVQLQSHLASLEHAVGDGRLKPLPADAAALDRLLEKQQVEGRSSLERRFQEWLGRMAERLLQAFTAFSRRRGGSTTLNVVLYTILALLSLLVLWASWRVLRSLRAALAARERVREAEQIEALPVVSAAEGLPADALSFADDLAREGRFREAVRALFGGAARSLVERGLVRQARTRTNGELLAETTPVAPDAEPPLRSLSAAFEAAWYGHVDPGEPGFAEARELYRSTLAAMPKRGDVA